MSLPVLPTEAMNFALDYVLGKGIDVGGGLVARYARATLARALGQRFGGGRPEELVAAPDLVLAQERLRAFVDGLDTRIRALESDRGLDTERLAALFARPEVTGALQSAFESAMDTSEPLIHATLADLIIARLGAADVSVDGVAARLAIVALKDMIPRQVRVLALIALLQTNWSRDRQEAAEPHARGAFIAWLERALAPFENIGFEFADCTHLRGLGLLAFDASNVEFTRQATVRLTASASAQFVGIADDVRMRDALAKVTGAASQDQRAITLDNLASCTLAPSGALIANQAFRELTGLVL